MYTCMYVCVSIYIYICVCIYMYIYIYKPSRAWLLTELCTRLPPTRSPNSQTLMAAKDKAFSSFRQQPMFTKSRRVSGEIWLASSSP